MAEGSPSARLAQPRPHRSGAAPKARRMNRTVTLSLETARSLYERQARIAWEGGILSRKERMLLDDLGTGLGLTVDETIMIEARVLGTVS